MPKYKAIKIGMCTLIGCPTSTFPTRHGNCFEVKVEEKMYDLKIVNFYFENLKHLLDNGLTFPILVQPVSSSHAIIDDDRIPEEFYETRYCECCCPERLWPEPQRKARERLISSGKLKITDLGNGWQSERMDIKAKMHPLKAKFTVEATEYIISNYIPINEILTDSNKNYKE
jgi:hypothetical protein